MSSQISPPLIVVGVDGSEASRAALRRAARQAELTGTKLRPGQAWRLPATDGMPVDYSDADFEKRVRESLRCTVGETLREQPGVPVDLRSSRVTRRRR
ncbi:universal stress protein [Streptomyces sp. NPDC026672]|uniref:universal stress protein n=1 Tax=Actinomycetes TaxID=1760 RepID=UPI0033FA689B